MKQGELPGMLRETRVTPGLRKTDNSHWADLTLRGLATDPALGDIRATHLYLQSQKGDR